MGIFSGQLLDIVEWNNPSEDVIFHKWEQSEIKKGSKLIIRPGQAAIFMYNGVLEGIFEDEGRFDIDSRIIPVLSTLSGFKYGFNSGLRAEVVFVNTKEFNVKWGTKSPINLPSTTLPGGMPIRSNGSYQFKVGDYTALIDKVAGIQKQYTVADVRERISTILDPLLLRAIVREGKDMFNIQAYAVEISEGLMKDLDRELVKYGLTVTGFQINSVSYPKEVQDMVTKVAGQSMVTDVNHYTQMAMADAIAKGNAGGGSNMAMDMASMQMGMAMGQQMAAQFQNNVAGTSQYAGQQVVQPQTANVSYASTGADGSVQGPNFCPSCGYKVAGAKFCPNCGQKLV